MTNQVSNDHKKQHFAFFVIVQKISQHVQIQLEQEMFT